ncbi:hypothetical protein SLEP1_g38209 [Rubroshorea leprosula]|uniref:Uncharacterized protein n=1 Tax=Rubroshorea leprosula TaxID=152421 RepID=A0AAV5KY39_9ROSI|nr:hypothetical protein SLEP1_g38209 [Rubroshorea leprosula]
MAFTLHDGGGGGGRRQTVSKSADPLIAYDRRVLVPDLVAETERYIAQKQFRDSHLFDPDVLPHRGAHHLHGLYHIRYYS